MSEFKIDYKKMFDEMKASLDRIIQEDEEYFGLLRENQLYAEYVNLIANNILHIKKSDQTKVLRIAKENGELCKNLCEKYGFEEE